MSVEKLSTLDLKAHPRGVVPPPRATLNVNDDKSSLYPLSGEIVNSIYVVELAGVVEVLPATTLNTGSDEYPRLSISDNAPEPPVNDISEATVLSDVVDG